MVTSKKVENQISGPYSTQGLVSVVGITDAQVSDTVPGVGVGCVFWFIEAPCDGELVVIVGPSVLSHVFDTREGYTRFDRERPGFPRLFSGTLEGMA